MKEIETLTHEEVSKKCRYIMPMKDWEIFEREANTMSGARKDIVLILQGDREDTAFAMSTDYEGMLALARGLARKLDPSPEDRVLSALERIEARLSD